MRKIIVGCIILNMKILIIDTADNKKISVGLKIDGKEFMKSKAVDANRTQGTLPLIVEILSEKKIKLSDLGAVKVDTGPGSFTGIRVGVSIANALGFVLKIPVNGKKPMHFVEPSYT